MMVVFAPLTADEGDLPADGFGGGWVDERLRVCLCLFTL